MEIALIITINILVGVIAYLFVLTNKLNSTRIILNSIDKMLAIVVENENELIKKYEQAVEILKHQQSFIESMKNNIKLGEEPEIDEDRYNEFIEYLEEQPVEKIKDSIKDAENQGWNKHAEIMKHFLKRKKS
jgi:hypothetical protein